MREAEAECEMPWLTDKEVLWRYPAIGKSAGKSCCGVVGEKFVRVVGFGAFRDIGGLVLGFSVGGERGRGVSEGSGCLPLDCGLLAQVAVDGGESGKEESGTLALLRVLIGLERSGLGNAALDMCGGDGGGEGVDVVERNVGREQESGDATEESNSGRVVTAFSIDLDSSSFDTRLGFG